MMKGSNDRQLMDCVHPRTRSIICHHWATGCYACMRVRRAGGTKVEHNFNFASYSGRSQSRRLARRYASSTRRCSSRRSRVASTTYQSSVFIRADSRFRPSENRFRAGTSQHSVCALLVSATPDRPARPFNVAVPVSHLQRVRRLSGRDVSPAQQRSESLPSTPRSHQTGKMHHHRRSRASDNVR